MRGSRAPWQRTTFDFLRSWLKKGPAERLGGRRDGRRRRRRLLDPIFGYGREPRTALGQIVRLMGFRVTRKRPATANYRSALSPPTGIFFAATVSAGGVTEIISAFVQTRRLSSPPLVEPSSGCILRLDSPRKINKARRIFAAERGILIDDARRLPVKLIHCRAVSSPIGSAKRSSALSKIRLRINGRRRLYVAGRLIGLSAK